MTKQYVGCAMILSIFQICVCTSTNHSIIKFAKYPDIFILGVQKAATTSLNKLMRTHAEICDNGVKEKHYFGFNDSWRKGSEFYDSMFASCFGVYTLDSNIGFSSTFVPDRLRITYNDTALASKKFILVLREPISREISW